MEPLYPFDVFVSYRWVSPDQHWVREQLEPALMGAGLRVFLDVNDFVPGRDLILEMTRAGAESARALCIMSPDHFEGNRMVSFESLAARRKDPSGAESRLIPLLLRRTDIPEWLRGLVPVDWTDERGLAREWRKLLTVLGARSFEAPPPNRIDVAREGDSQSPSVLPARPARIASVLNMVPREGFGFGYDIVLTNDGHENLFVEKIEIAGERAMQIDGAGALVDRVSYDVVLDSWIGEEETNPVTGVAYASSSPDFGSECSGAITYEVNTQTQEKWWRYAISVPVVMRIPAKDRVIVSLRFRRNMRSVAQRWTEGYSRGFHEPNIVIRDEHLLTAKLQGGGALSHEVDLKLLTFLLGREELVEGRGNLLPIVSSSMRDGEEYVSEARQATPAHARELLEQALSRYRMADKLLSLLPRDYQDHRHSINRAIRMLERELSDPRGIN
jgi:hypothetical protein